MYLLKRKRFCMLLLLIIIYGQRIATAQDDDWPRRVLITNDNGIDDIKIIELARAFSRVAETVVVAPMEDRSGASSYMPLLLNKQVRVEKRNIGHGVEAYAVDGFPADCVLLGLTGIMYDDPPDLVVSGINGGANLGQDWFGSGTVGAARVAAFAGFPALAVSGLDDDFPESVKAANSWVVKLAQSPVLRSLQKGQYLTVSIPRIAPDQIKGVRVSRRAGLRRLPLLTPMHTDTADYAGIVWHISGVEQVDDGISGQTDVSIYEAGYVVLVPMMSYEDISLPLKIHEKDIPQWPYLQADD